MKSLSHLCGLCQLRVLVLCTDVLLMKSLSHWCNLCQLCVDCTARYTCVQWLCLLTFPTVPMTYVYLSVLTGRCTVVIWQSVLIPVVHCSIGKCHLGFYTFSTFSYLREWQDPEHKVEFHAPSGWRQDAHLLCSVLLSLWMSISRNLWCIVSAIIFPGAEVIVYCLMTEVPV